MIRVLVADDHVIMRNGLKQLCEAMGDVTVAGEAENGDQVMQVLGNTTFDLILLDLTMPGVNGADLVERIRRKFPQLPILIFSMRNELQVAKRVLQAGATGYLTKGSRQDMLMAAIRKVASGERFVDPDIVEEMMFEKAKKPVRTSAYPNERLSERELQIMKLFAQGKTVTEIGEELFISTKTVSTHKTRLMQKMHFKSNADLVLYAAEFGLNKIEPD